MRDLTEGTRVRLNYQRYSEAYRNGTAVVLSYDPLAEIYTLLRDPGTTTRGNEVPVVEHGWPHWHVFSVNRDDS
jgi:hypothetical protein